MNNLFTPPADRSARDPGSASDPDRHSGVPYTAPGGTPGANSSNTSATTTPTMTDRSGSAAGSAPALAPGSVSDSAPVAHEAVGAAAAPAVDGAVTCARPSWCC